LGGLTLIGKIKGDDVRIIVMLKELAVNVQQVRIGAEDILEFSQGLPLPLEKGGQESFEPGPIRQGNGREEIKLNGGIIHNFTKMKRLSELEPGTVARIHSFEKNDLFLKLMEMGCVPGELVRVEQIAPLGDPISITVAGYNLSLRLDEAENIFMEEAKR
jgi:Fe2+ transport system protein FeoA